MVSSVLHAIAATSVGMAAGVGVIWPIVRSDAHRRGALVSFPTASVGLGWLAALVIVVTQVAMPQGQWSALAVGSFWGVGAVLAAIDSRTSFVAISSWPVLSAVATCVALADIDREGLTRHGIGAVVAGTPCVLYFLAGKTADGDAVAACAIGFALGFPFGFFAIGLGAIVSLLVFVVRGVDAREGSVVRALPYFFGGAALTMCLRPLLSWMVY